MADYVLVHGAWGGGHSYDRTSADLIAAGHRVLVCALRGLGSRQGELHGGITLTDHIADVCQQIAEAGFDRFVLVGHSYGGMVITGVAARLGARIDAICYVDAFLPADGQSLWHITGDYEHAWYVESQKHTPGLVAPIGGIDFVEVPGRVGRHPLLTLIEAVSLTGEEAAIPRRAYIHATGWNPTPFNRFAEAVRDDLEWDFHQAPCGHHVMSDEPELTLRVLLELAE